MSTVNHLKSSTRAAAFSALARFLVLPAATDVALAQEGLIGWGDQVVDSHLQAQGFVELAAGDFHTVARRSDGSVVAWGDNRYGQCNVPALPPGLSYVEVATVSFHTVARRSDGSAVAWGHNFYGQCNVPALAPGLTFAQLAAGRFRTMAIVQSGAYTTFGAGCPGSVGVTRLEAITPPRLGQTMTVRMQPLPQSVAMLLAGLSNVTAAAGPLPLDLSPFGLTNCRLRVRPDVSVVVIGAGGSASFALAVPTSPSLAGLILHQQALVLDPAAGNPAGLVMSDAATAVVGS